MVVSDSAEGHGSPSYSESDDELDEGFDVGRNGLQGRSDNAGISKASGAISELDSETVGLVIRRNTGSGGSIENIISTARSSFRRDSSEDGASADEAIDALSTQLFEVIRLEFEGEPIISSIHWILIHRACEWFAQAILLRDDRADKIALSLLVEIVRVLRSQNELVQRLEVRIAEVFQKAIPDPVARAKFLRELKDIQ